MLDVIRSRRGVPLIVVGEGFSEFEESPVLEVEKLTMGNLQLMRKGVFQDPAVMLIGE